MRRVVRSLFILPLLTTLLAFSLVSCGGGAEQPSVKTFKSANQSYNTDDLYRFFAVAFGAAPGVTYMGQLIEAAEWGLSIKEIVNIFTTKPQFTDTYPVSMSNADFATKLVEKVVGSSATSQAKQEAVNDIVSALSLPNWTRGDVIYAVFNNLAKKPESDAKWYGTAKKMANQIVYAKYYTETMKGDTTTLEILKRVVSNVTELTGTASGMEKFISDSIGYFIEVAGAIPDLGYVSDSIGGQAGLVHPAMADINGDGLDDMVLHFWAPAGTVGGIAPPTGTQTSAPCLNRVIFLINQGNYKFLDQTSKYLKGTDDLGGCSAGVEVADINNDGKPDIVYSINQEDGRGAEIIMSDFYGQLAGIISRPDGTYSVQKFGIPNWYHSIGVGYETNSLAFVTGGGANRFNKQQTHTFDAYGTPNTLKTLIPELASDGGYPTGKSVSGDPFVSGFVFKFYTDSAVDKTSKYLIQASRDGFGVEGYAKVNSSWIPAETLASPFAIADYTTFIDWNNTVKNYSTVSKYGNQYFMLTSASFTSACQLKISPSSKPIILFGGGFGIIPNYKVGQTLSVKSQDLVPYSFVQGLTIENGKVVSVDLKIDNQKSQDQNSNMNNCRDINGDGYDDIVAYPISPTGTPVVYLNNKNGGFTYLDSNKFPTLKENWWRATAVLHSFNKQGLTDLLVFSPSIQTQGINPNTTTTSFHFYKAIKPLD